MRPSTASLAFCLCVFAACDASDPCDRDQRYQQGTCVPAARDAASTPERDGGPRDASADADVGADSGSDCTAPAALGTTCTGDDACNCTAPYCAVMPGQPSGTCTLHCRPDANDCPPNYRCFDLSSLGVPGITPFCIAN